MPNPQANKTALDNKLIWLVKSAAKSHHGCEYRQDGLERASVRCAGCYHSSESSKKAVQNVVDFVHQLLEEQRVSVVKETLGHVEDYLDSEGWCDEWEDEWRKELAKLEANLASKGKVEK